MSTTCWRRAGRSAVAVHIGVVEVVRRSPGALVRFASIHHLPEQSSPICRSAARRSANDARIEWIIGDLNNGNTLSDTNRILKGNGSISDSKVICVGTGVSRT